MSTQRREGRGTPTTGIGQWGLWHGSRVARCMDRTTGREWKLQAQPARNLPANTARRTAPLEVTAWLATNSLRTDQCTQQPTGFICVGSPPTIGMQPMSVFIAHPKSFSIDPPPAVIARIHSTLPHVAAARRSPTERYDGKRNLHFQHAA